MNFKNYLVGISILLTSAAAFAQPNTFTLDGHFINKSTSTDSKYNFIQGWVWAENGGDYSYIKVDSGIPVNQTFHIPGSSGIYYSIELSNLKGIVHIRLDDPNFFPEPECEWLVSSTTSKANPPQLSSWSTSGCNLTGVYDFSL